MIALTDYIPYLKDEIVANQSSSYFKIGQLPQYRNINSPLTADKKSLTDRREDLQINVTIKWKVTKSNDER